MSMTMSSEWTTENWGMGGEEAGVTTEALLEGWAILFAVVSRT